MKENARFIGFRLYPKQIYKLKEIAQKKNIKQSKAVRTIIDEYVL